MLKGGRGGGVGQGPEGPRPGDFPPPPQRGGGAPPPANNPRPPQPGAAALRQHLDRRTEPKKKVAMVAGFSEETLHDIAESSSQTERAADDAERELLEWNKVKFMQDRLGAKFAALIVSVTKLGLFVDLNDLFICA